MSEKNVLRPVFETVRSITLDVIVKNFKKYSTYKSNSKINLSLCQYCRNVLLNQVVEVNLRVTPLSLRLANVYGITHMLANKLITKNNLPLGIITESTKIHITSVHSDEFYELSLSIENLPELGGLEVEFKKFEQLFYIHKSKTNLYRPHGILLYGPPGCGKTSFAKRVAKKLGAIFYNVESSSLLLQDFGSGASALRDVFDKAFTLTVEGPVILFLDEIDMLCPRPDSASLGNRQLSYALMAEIDKIQRNNVSSLLILAATNAVSNIDPCLRRPGRFDQEVLINIPTEKQRLSILQVLTSPLRLASDVSCMVLAQMTPGYVGADLRGLCEEATNHAQNETLQHLPELCMEDFNFALHNIIPSLKKGTDCVVDMKPVKWNEIGSLDEVKAEIKQSLEWPLKYPKILKNMDIPPVKGILLYGPPGCCKTTLVRAAASSCNVSFLSLSGAQIYSAFVGESERLISQAFQKARALAPSILFLDEIESLVGKRSVSVGNNRVQERILSTMLNEMDGVGNRLDLKLESTALQVDSENPAMQKLKENNLSTESELMSNESYVNNDLKVIVVGATNRPDMLDSAILRPGRLDKHIYVPPPDSQARKAIINIYTSTMSCTDLDMDYLVGKTDLFSGADLKNLCKEAGLLALREQRRDTKSLDSYSKLMVTMQHFFKALDYIKPSLTHEMLRQYQK